LERGKHEALGGFGELVTGTVALFKPPMPLEGVATSTDSTVMMLIVGLAIPDGGNTKDVRIVMSPWDPKSSFDEAKRKKLSSSGLQRVSPVPHKPANWDPAHIPAILNGFAAAFGESPTATVKTKSAPKRNKKSAPKRSEKNQVRHNNLIAVLTL
jgi:hypothetical protein